MPGDRVDVAATLDFSGSGVDISPKPALSSRTLKCWLLDGFWRLRTRAGLSGEKWKTVTLAVLPEEAQPLILASERGSIRMLLRSPADSGNRIWEPAVE